MSKNLISPKGGDNRGSSRNAITTKDEEDISVFPLRHNTQEQNPRDVDFDEEFALRALWRVIAFRKWSIFSIALGFVLLALLITMLITPIYRASLLLRIDREQAKVVQFEEVEQEFTGADRDFYQTQFVLLKSRKLAKRVIDDLGDQVLQSKAEQDAESVWQSLRESLQNLLLSISGSDQDQDQNTNMESEAERDAESVWQPLKKFLLSILGSDQDQNTNMETEETSNINRFVEKVSISPIRNSRLVQIQYDHTDASIAARTANSIADNFININLEHRYNASTYAKDFLQDRISQMKEKLENSERDLLEYAKDRGIVNLDKDQSLVDRELSELSQVLGKAQELRIRAEAEYESSSTNLSSNSEVLSSPVIQGLKQSQAELEAEYQEKLKTYKEKFPLMQELRSQVDEIKRQIESEIRKIRNSIKEEYQERLRVENKLSDLLKEKKKELMSYRERSIEYNNAKRDVDSNRQLYEGLLQRMREVGVVAGVGSNNIAVVDRAETPLSPHRPKIYLNLSGGLVLGLFFGIGLAFLREALDDTINSPEDLEQKYGFPVLGIIPLIDQKARKDKNNEGVAMQAHNDPGSMLGEAFRTIRTSLMLSTSEGAPKVLHITSPTPSEGKTTTATGMALSFASNGNKVLLIDCDMRKPSVHKGLQLDNQYGLSTYLSGNNPNYEDVIEASNVDRLDIITSGPPPPNPVELIHSTKMVQLIDDLRNQFDLVILDSPPVLGLSDALLLGHLADASLIMVKPGTTKKNHFEDAVKRLLRSHAHIIGAIVAMMEKKHQRNMGYGYYDYYNYSNEENKRLSNHTS